jgi:hypothetical protein
VPWIFKFLSTFPGFVEASFFSNTGSWLLSKFRRNPDLPKSSPWRNKHLLELHLLELPLKFPLCLGGAVEAHGRGGAGAELGRREEV